MAFWSLLADFSFSDLLLFVPATRIAARVRGRRCPSSGPPRLQAFDRLGTFVVLGQIRPTTSQTLYEVDLVGQVQSAQSLPSMVEAYQTGVIVRAEQPSASADGLVRITHIPVRHRGKVSVCSAASGRHGPPGAGARWNGSISSSSSGCRSWSPTACFLSTDDDAAVEEAPRVGDGVLVVDAQRAHHLRVTERGQRLAPCLDHLRRSSARAWPCSGSRPRPSTRRSRASFP